MTKDYDALRAGLEFHTKRIPCADCPCAGKRGLNQAGRDYLTYLRKRKEDRCLKFNEADAMGWQKGREGADEGEK